VGGWAEKASEPPPQKEEVKYTGATYVDHPRRALRAIGSGNVLGVVGYLATRFRRWLVLPAWRLLDWLLGRNSVSC